MEQHLSLAKSVMQKGKHSGAAFINAECVKGPPFEHLECLLDVILNPNKKIDDTENIDWCKWLIAGGRTPTDFAAIGKDFIYIHYTIQE